MRRTGGKQIYTVGWDAVVAESFDDVARRCGVKSLEGALNRGKGQQGGGQMHGQLVYSPSGDDIFWYRYLCASVSALSAMTGGGVGVRGRMIGRHA